MQREQVIDGLRAAADFFEAHPELPLSFPTVSCHFGAEASKDEALAAIRLIAPCRVHVSTTGGGAVFIGDVGGVAVRVFISTALLAAMPSPEIDPAFLAASEGVELEPAP